MSKKKFKPESLSPRLKKLYTKAFKRAKELAKLKLSAKLKRLPRAGGKPMTAGAVPVNTELSTPPNLTSSGPPVSTQPIQGAPSANQSEPDSQPEPKPTSEPVEDESSD